MIRDATADDAAAIAAIYNEGIADRQATFETTPRTAADFEDGTGGALPFVVYEEDGRVLGWARVTPFSARRAYAGVGEASIYVAREARGRGLGRRLLDALTSTARDRGHWKLIGLIFPENAASVAIFRAAGWRDVGTYRRHGRLDGEWRDVLLVERSLDA